ncbi:helicase domain protein, partial [Vibrio parahaemolyticus V-223/04]
RKVLASVHLMNSSKVKFEP